jgi:hypothetical protein
VVAPVVPAPIVTPRLPIFRWPWERQNDYPQYPPQQQWPPQQQNPWNPPQQQSPWNPPKQDKPSWDPPKQQWPQQSGSGRGSDSHDDDSGGGRGSNGGGNSPLWPWGSWGH